MAAEKDIPQEELAGMSARLKALGKEHGIEFNYDIMQASNTFEQHRLIYYAGTKSLEFQQTLALRFLRATFSEGLPTADKDLLTRLCLEVAETMGLPSEEIASQVKQVMSTNVYVNEVRQEQADAKNLGSVAVPFFLFNATYAITGAQPEAVFLEALELGMDSVQKNTPVAHDTADTAAQPAADATPTLARGECKDGVCGI